MAGLGTTVALIKSMGKPDPTVIEQSVSDWLDDHPEATTTVQDGSITKAKLDTNLQETVDDVSDLKNAVNANSIISTTSGNPVANFSDGADGAPIQSLVVEIKATQESGTPSPTNPLAITGYTGVTIYHSDDDTSDPETVSASWQTEAGTVYFGTVNLITGVLTATHAYKKYTGTAEAWEILGTNPRVAVIPWDEVKNTGITLCNMCEPNNWKQDQPDYGRVENTAGGYNIRANIITEDMTKAEFKAWLADHPLEIVCPLITPVEYEIDPITLNTLLGENNVWASTGAIQEISYHVDIKTFIENSGSEVEIDDTAGEGDTDVVWSANKSSEEINDLKATKADAIVATVSGDPVANFPDGVENLPVQSLLVDIKATQEAGTPSPTNPLAITGYNGVTIYHSGEDTSDPTTVSASWQTEAGTVYFGTVNLITGILTVTHGYKKYTGTAEAWEILSTNARVAVIPWNEVKNTGVTLCNMCEPNTWKQDQPSYGRVENADSGYNIRVNIITEDMTKAQFKAWLADHPLEIVCPLLSPVEYQIDPITMNTLRDENNVWASTGAILEITYSADIKNYIRYASLPDKPSINGTEIAGSKDGKAFGIYPAFGRKTCAIFEKVCVIGDSYAAGTIRNSTGTSVTVNEYAWPAHIAKQTGKEFVNCGCSGATSATWLTRQDGLAKAQLPENKAQAYIVGLQINDIGAGMSVGTISDIGKQADTYIGYISQIIDNVFTINNSAHVFMLTQPKTQAGTYQLYNQAIRDIVTWYQTSGNGTHQGQVHLIDLVEQAAIFEEPGCMDSKVADHFTAVGYEYVAEIIMYAWSKYINAHPLLFQDVNLIPYGSAT